LPLSDIGAFENRVNLRTKRLLSRVSLWRTVRATFSKCRPSGAFAFVVCFELMSQFDEMRHIAQPFLILHAI